MRNEKNAPKPITQADLSQFVQEESSFAFEMKVRELFAAKRFRYRHGGTYDDPHTGLPRQFDVTVDLNLSGAYIPFRLRMAIECKCLSEFAPMLVYRSPRSAYEAGHHVIARTCGDRDAVEGYMQHHANPPKFSGGTGPFPECCTLELPASRCMYSSGEFVGKSIECVSKDRVGNFKGGDKEIYGRWSQALQSASALLPNVTGDFYGNEKFVINWIIPILVVPDDRLYVVDFDDAGTQRGDPALTGRTSFFVDYKPTTISIDGPEFRFGHLEIMTFSALKNFVERATGEDSRIFVEEHISDQVCMNELSHF